MHPEPPPKPALEIDALAYGEAWLNWKTRPRLGAQPPPNPADYHLSPEQGQMVIDQCTRVIEQAAVEKSTKAASQPERLTQ